MKCKALLLLAIVSLTAFPLQAKADVVLGTAGNFAVLGGSTVTNTGATLISGGDVGVSPGTAITGFLAIDSGPGIIMAPFTTHTGADAVAVLAHNDLITAFNASQALPFLPANNLSGQGLGGLTLLPGVYHFNTSASLSGTLSLDKMGDPNAEFVFQIGTTLTTASNSSVITINGGLQPGSSVFWQVGTSATLGTNTAFQGHILADQSITLTTGASILNGSALAAHAGVTLDTNRVTNPGTALPGDYNHNGIVDAADYVVWRKGLGSTFTQNDYNVWRSNFGQTAGSGSGAVANAVVPEPATLTLLTFAAASWCLRRRRAA
jgi:adhesin HecA-like repeat protein